MTKKYIITKDQIESTVGTSEFPPSSTAVKTAVDGKVAINQGVAHVGKALVVGNDGNVTVGTIEAQTQADWTQATTTDPSYIKNKPFVSIGTGLSVTSGVLNATAQFQFKIFTTLPTAGPEYAQIIGLIENTSTPGTYKQYACVNQGTTEAPNWQWVEVGSGEFEVPIEQTTEGISINSTALQSASATHTGLLTHANWTTFNGKQDALTFDSTPTAGSTNPVTSGGIKTALDLKEDVANKVTAWTSTVTNTHYPSEKLVKDSLDAKVTKVAGVVNLGHDEGGYYFEE